jgi:cobalamin biosynthesis protein CobD/CbiB
MTRFERWAVWSSSVLTFVTGVIYLWLKYGLETDDPFAVVNHPWQPVVLKIHILVAPILVFSVGMVALRHIWRHLQSGSREGRRSGLITLVALGPMIATGYLIQAITDEGWLRAMAWSHIGLGLLYGIGLLAHQFAAGGRHARADRARKRRVRRHQRHQRRHAPQAGPRAA